MRQLGITRFRDAEPKHQKCENGTGREKQKRRGIPEAVDYVAGNAIAQRGADPPGCPARSLGEIVMTGALREVGNDDEEEGAENTRPDAVQDLNGDQRIGVLCQRVENAADWQHRKTDEKDRLATPRLGLVADENGHWH